MGMIWSNGYCPNPIINGLGGNWIPWHSHDAVVNLVALPELSDHVRWIAKTCEDFEAPMFKAPETWVSLKFSMIVKR